MGVAGKKISASMDDGMTKAKDPLPRPTTA
jgi:hypothetical protein